MPSPPFERLDFLYMPSADVGSDLEHFTRILGAEVVFAIEAFAAGDPYVEAGLVTARRVEPWNVSIA